MLLAGVAWGMRPTLSLPQRVEAVPAAMLLPGGLLLWPLLTAGAGWRSTALFAAAPDPAALLSLGLLPLLDGRARWALLPIPALWCGFSGATLLAMERSAGGFLLAAPLLAVAGCWLAARSARA